MELLQFVVSPFELFSRIWTVIYVDGTWGWLITVDTFICLLGASASLVVIPLIPVDGEHKAWSYVQRATIGLVGFSLFSIFFGHIIGVYIEPPIAFNLGEYEKIRFSEFLIHFAATTSLITGAVLRSKIRGTLKKKEEKIEKLESLQ